MVMSGCGCLFFDNGCGCLFFDKVMSGCGCLFFDKVLSGCGCLFFDMVMSGCGCLFFDKVMSGCLFFEEGKVSDELVMVLFVGLFVFVADTLCKSCLFFGKTFSVTVLFSDDCFCVLILFFGDTFCELFLIFDFRHLPDVLLIKEVLGTQLLGLPGGGCFSASPLPSFPPPTLRRPRRPHAPCGYNHFGCNRSGSNRSGCPVLLCRVLVLGLGLGRLRCCPSGSQSDCEDRRFRQP